MPTSQ
jgi:NADH dehydrogenase [ubiquinone] 1 alpha subcomplex assembly factor 6